MQPDTANEAAACTRRSALYHEASLLSIAIAAAVIVLFRTVIFSGFDTILASPHDGLLNHALTAHWWEVLTGKVPWHTVQMYYPARGTLGYSDGMFLFGMCAAVFRALGADPFVALQLTLMVFAVVGGATMHLLLRRHLHMSPLAAGIGALFVILAAPIQSAPENGHLQLMAVWLAPAELVGVAETLRAAGGARRSAAVLWAVATGGIVGLLFFTAFYIAWFLCVLVGAGLLLWLLLATVPRERVALAALQRFPTPNRAATTLALAGIAFVITLLLVLVPFAQVYLPAARDLGTRSWEHHVAISIPSWIDMVHVNAGNLLWGRLLGANLSTGREGTAFEWHYGFPPLTQAILWLAVAVAAFRLRRGHAPAQLVVAIGLLSIVSWLAATNTFGIWRLAFDSVPGASAIRAPSRINIVMCLGVAIAISWLVQTILSRYRGGWVLALLLVVTATLFGEQMLKTRKAVISRRWFKETIAAPPLPGPAEAIYVSDAAYSWDPWINQMRALFIAQEQDVPTIFGYSGVRPKEWWMDVATHEEEWRLYWLKLNDVKGPVWCYDIQSREWNRLNSQLFGENPNLSISQ